MDRLEGEEEGQTWQTDVYYEGLLEMYGGTLCQQGLQLSPQRELLPDSEGSLRHGVRVDRVLSMMMQLLSQGLWCLLQPCHHYTQWWTANERNAIKLKSSIGPCRPNFFFLSISPPVKLKRIPVFIQASKSTHCPWARHPLCRSEDVVGSRWWSEGFVGTDAVGQSFNTTYKYSMKEMDEGPFS